MSLTREDAFAEAAARTSAGDPCEVWEHVGGENPKGRILSTGRFLVRPVDKPPPKWAWAKVTVLTGMDPA